MLPTRAVIYTRVSTEDQVKEGYSLPAQERALRELAEQQNYEITGIYTDDGISGKNIHRRTELKRMLSDAEKNKFDIVLFYKLDRLSRNVKDAYTIIDILVKNNIGVLSYTETHINLSTAQQRAMFGMSMVFAQLEVEQISERVIFGMKEAARTGKPMFSPPYGYKLIDGKVETIPEEVLVIKKVFSLYQEGNGFNSIARILNNEGIKSPKGSYWHANTINRMLQNKAYYGVQEIKFEKAKTIETVEGVYPIIISKDSFLEVQEMRESKAQLHPKTASMHNTSPIFSGFLTCSRCGSAISTTGFAKGLRRYRCCASASNACKLPSFYEHYLEEIFITSMISINSPFHDSEDRLAVESVKGQKVIQLKHNIIAIQNKKQKNHFAWENDLISDEFYKSRIFDLNSEEELTLSELRKLESNSIAPKLFQLKDLDFKKLWNGFNNQNKKKFLMTYIDEIIIDTTGINPINNFKKSTFNPVKVIEIKLK